MEKSHCFTEKIDERNCEYVKTGTTIGQKDQNASLRDPKRKVFAGILADEEALIGEEPLCIDIWRAETRVKEKWVFQDGWYSI